MSDQNNPLVLSGDGTPLGVGRPLRWEQAVEAAGLSSTDLSYDEIAKAIGISVRTLYNWRASPWWAHARNEALGDRVRRYEAKAISNIMEAVENGDVKASQWLLARTSPETFGEPRARAGADKKESGRSAAPVLPELEYDELSDAELASLAGYDK